MVATDAKKLLVLLCNMQVLSEYVRQMTTAVVTLHMYAQAGLRQLESIAHNSPVWL